ncbi:Flagellar secretion chaperone FliS [bioreactor metagenome]|uniref:Flagellar secretion chaperone FliS n=1 Tax=bioreactor metagenome TaxID=1076179 RepID=A0A644XJK9_9ZZZZ
MDYRQSNLRQEYLRQSVMTASPAELVVMLFDACIKNLKLAEICVSERRDMSGAHTHFSKAQQIVMELICCLDTSYEISARLLEIYEFLLHSIRDMNVKKDVTALPDVLEILTSQRDTWQKISRPAMAPSEVS